MLVYCIIFQQFRFFNLFVFAKKGASFSVFFPFCERLFSGRILGSEQFTQEGFP